MNSALLRSFGWCQVVAFALCAQQVTAQCPFDPTITPDAPILCPNSQLTLSTQQYDGYQWYKDGSLILGANEQTYVVDANTDAGSNFSVEAYLDFCAELSPEVLVDGWAFLPPTVMTVADTPVGFTPDYTLYCEGADLMLIMNLPYDTNIQWYNMGTPIPGATNDTLVVTENGQYSASGAPSICPEFLQQLGVQVGIFFFVPIQPAIVPGTTDLCAYPSGTSYQWYFNDQLIAGSDSSCIDGSQPGSYVVIVDYEQSCDLVPSEPHLVTSIPTTLAHAPMTIHPQLARDRITVSWNDGTMLTGWRIMDATGRLVKQQHGAIRSPLTIAVQDLSEGRYLFATNGSVAIAFAVVD